MTTGTRRASLTRASCLLLLVFVGACSTGRHTGAWAPQEMIIPGTLPREQQVRIWSGEKVFRWRAVTYTRDSVTGIPHEMPVTCDSCRIALPRDAVDSIRVRHVVTSRDRRLMLGYFALGVAALAIFQVH